MANRDKNAEQGARAQQRTNAATPVQAATQASRVAPVYLHPLLIEATRVGVATGPMFRGLGFAPEDLDRPGFDVSHQEAITVVRRALRILDSPSLGLELGTRSRITHRGAMALGLFASPTLGSSTDLMLRYPRSAGFLLDVHAVQNPKRHALVAQSTFGSHDLADFLVDKLFAGIVRQRRQTCDSECSPIAVELMRPPPTTALTYERHYRCPVKFNCAANQLVFDAAWMSRPLPMANPMAFSLSEQLLEREATRLRGISDLGLAVKRAIGLALPAAPNAAMVASILNVSERNLRRRLAADSLSFRALLDDSRRALALTLMSNAERPIAEVALRTGFSDARSFRRAFRRWTDSSPSELRSAGLADVDTAEWDDA